MMIFEMSETQKNKLDKWQDAIKTVYGKKGNYEYIFKPKGDGYSITVYSELADFELDLTETENY
jgi:NAD-dependent DNA ligase